MGRLKVQREWIGCVDADTVGGTCEIRYQYEIADHGSCIRKGNTDGQLAMILIKGDVIKRHVYCRRCWRIQGLIW